MTQISLIAELEKLAIAMNSDGERTETSLSSVANLIAKSFGVKPEEVAILSISTKWKHLHFLVPESLKNVGFIPLSSNSALAARTVRDKRPEIVNKFADVRHASVFEGIKSPDITGETIQKIVSAPILSGGKVIGVMQISRKGSSAKNAGPDFSTEDMGKVVALCAPLGKFLHHFVKE
jgi:transcriptional regulator with GAF, ATPase, and Fis domain